MTSFFHQTSWLLALLLALASCHEAPRNNPFDPALTPAVELQVALDDTAGTATLTWTPYQGQQPFAEYRVLRNIADRKSVDTLVHIPAVEQTAFVDTTLAPNTAYTYRVAVVNAAGYETPSEERSVAGFGVGVVRLLGVESDPQAGTLTLRWNRYVGPDFAGYQLHRRVVGTDQEEVVATRGAVTDTSLVDSSALAGVEYLYTLVVQAAGQDLLSNAQVGRLVLPPVAITRADFSSAEAAASLTWTRYQGPRFKAYRVERRTVGLTFQVVQELTELTSTSYVDTGLAGNTEYFYRVKVETQRGEEILSEEQRGIFHQRLATWPLEMEEDGYVRLYWEEDRLAALVAETQQVRLFFFDAQGALLEEQGLLDYPGLDIEPRSVATALNPDGSRFLSFGEAEMLSLLRLGADGHAIQKPPQPVFVDSLTSLKVTQGEGASRIRLDGFSRTIFDNVVVTDKAGVLFAEDFGGGNPEEVWDILTSDVTMVDGHLLVTGVSGVVIKEEEAWQDYRLEADVILPLGGQGRIYIGNLRDTVIFLALYEDLQRLTLFLNPPEGDPRVFRQPFPLVPWTPYRLGLGLMGGQVSASVQSPVAWRAARERDVPWACLAGIEGSLLLLAEPQSHKLPWESEAFTDSAPLGSAISEVRIWKIAGSTRRRVGICLPEEHQVRTGVATISNGKILTNFVGTTAAVLGTQVGQGEGAFIYPLSFDASPDGRIYVLDAGNARLQVFDAEGKYLTQWGRKGSGEGEFDFGSGRVPEDFAGSVAVDNEGYIYVADVGNRRIQKFAP